MYHSLFLCGKSYNELNSNFWLLLIVFISLKKQIKKSLTKSFKSIDIDHMQNTPPELSMQNTSMVRKWKSSVMTYYQPFKEEYNPITTYIESLIVVFYV
jgi:hypothetical protein